MQKELLP
jgi:hypothetical protein